MSKSKVVVFESSSLDLLVCLEEKPCVKKGKNIKNAYCDLATQYEVKDCSIVTENEFLRKWSTYTEAQKIDKELEAIFHDMSNVTNTSSSLAKVVQNRCCNIFRVSWLERMKERSL